MCLCLSRRCCTKWPSKVPSHLRYSMVISYLISLMPEEKENEKDAEGWLPSQSKLLHLWINWYTFMASLHFNGYTKQFHSEGCQLCTGIAFSLPSLSLLIIPFPSWPSRAELSQFHLWWETSVSRWAWCKCLSNFWIEKFLTLFPTLHPSD